LWVVVLSSAMVERVLWLLGIIKKNSEPSLSFLCDIRHSMRCHCKSQDSESLVFLELLFIVFSSCYTKRSMMYKCSSICSCLTIKVCDIFRNLQGIWYQMKQGIYCNTLKLIFQMAQQWRPNHPVCPSTQSRW
jgi:hypothetical protein